MFTCILDEQLWCRTRQALLLTLGMSLVVGQPPIVNVYSEVLGLFGGFLNDGIPRSSIWIGFSTRNHPFWGCLIYETSIWTCLLFMWLCGPEVPLCSTKHRDFFVSLCHSGWGRTHIPTLRWGLLKVMQSYNSWTSCHWCHPPVIPSHKLVYKPI